MFEDLKIQKKIAENMKDDDELDKLLGEIPHATSSLDAHHQQNNHVGHGYGHASCAFQKMNGHGHGYGESHVHGMCNDELLNHNYACASSTVSGFSFQSDGSSSSLLPGGVRSLYNIGSPPPFQELKTHLISGNRFRSDFENEYVSNSFDDFNLSRNFSKMYISEKQECVGEFLNGVQSCNRSPNAAIRMNLDKCGVSDNFRKGFSAYERFNPPVPGGPVNIKGQARSPLMEMQYDQRIANLSRSRYSPSRFDDFGNSALSPQFYGPNLFANNSFPMEFVVPDASCGDTFLCSRNGMNLIEARDPFCSPSVVQLAHLMPHYSEEDILQYQPVMPNGRNRVPLHIDPFTREDSLIIQGESISRGTSIGNARLRRHNTKGLLLQENGGVRPQEKTLQVEGCRSPRMSFPFSLSSKCSSLAEARGYIYHMAKDQNGCRFLQRVFDEETSQDVQIIFTEIIEHVVELMMNPFGNYLMQKLLEVCDEQQRMLILLRVTEVPGDLVTISLNTHGTRVVQKLIETLKTRQQISLAIAALEPGFLSLIKDLNGNHVVQRCLQCFTSEDSKFIFVAATKYCVEIATHQHGCCVLQRCISHSSGVLRENLVSEISANGLLLAQDAYGNYVIQFILELKIPSALSKLTYQFEGNYVNLSRQKFSSHVVEKCLVVCKDEVKSKIIHELLSTSYFDQLLQDPHANYVVQTALRVSEGPVHDSLVDSIESFKAISRNSPYSKRIFSNKLLKR